MVILMVRSAAKGDRWKKHGEYPDRQSAWEAITALPDRRAHVRLVEADNRPPVGEVVPAAPPVSHE